MTAITIVSGNSWTYIQPVDSGTTSIWGAGFNQTLTADQARAILASGNPRDIAAFGGEAALRQLAGQ